MIIMLGKKGFKNLKFDDQAHMGMVTILYNLLQYAIHLSANNCAVCYLYIRCILVMFGIYLSDSG